MKLATLVSGFAILGCVGVVAVGSMASQGCTATVTTGSGDDTNPNPNPNPITGDDDDSGTPATQLDAGTVPPNPCNECLYETCSGLFAACVNDLTCLGIYNCSKACAAGDDSCLTSCSNQAAPSVALYDNLGSCDFVAECNTGCTTQCALPASYCEQTGDDDSGTVADAGGTSDDAGTTADSATAQTCEQCQASACASQLAGVATGTPGFAYTQCILGCTTADCPGICASNSPAGVNATKAMGDCTSLNCAVCAQ